MWIDRYIAEQSCTYSASSWFLNLSSFSSRANSFLDLRAVGHNSGCDEITAAGGLSSGSALIILYKYTTDVNTMPIILLGVQCTLLTKFISHHKTFSLLASSSFHLNLHALLLTQNSKCLIKNSSCVISLKVFITNENFCVQGVVDIVDVDPIDSPQGLVYRVSFSYHKKCLQVSRA